LLKPDHGDDRNGDGDAVVFYQVNDPVKSVEIGRAHV
jgi:hypothetical protein